MAVADLVVKNGKVCTVDRDFSFCEAVATKGGWIIDTGSNEEMEAYIGPDTQVIDLEGRLMLPAAYDSHAHGYNFGMGTLIPDFGEDVVHGWDDVKRILSKALEGKAPGEWLRGQGINLEAIEAAEGNGFRVTCKELDEIAPDNPVFITFWSMHGLVCNSKALEAAGIDKNSPDPGSGVIVRDEEGNPLGVFLEPEPMYLIFDVAPQITDAQVEEGIMVFQRILNEQGYTGYTESSCDIAEGKDGAKAIEAYKRIYESGRLTNRVTIGIISGTPDGQTFANMDHDLDVWQPPFDDPQWLKVSLVKIFCDGVHLAHTAWMLDDYEGCPGDHGLCSIPGATEEEQTEELHKMILSAHRHGYQVGVHAIGDRAVQTVIEGFIKAKQEMPEKHMRHYVIHGDSLGTPEQAKLAAKFGIPYSVQPGMQNVMYEASIECLGQARGERVFGLREPIDAGVVCCGGADAIHGHYTNWREAVSQAMTRRSAITGQVVRGDLAITLEEGIRLFTTNAAYQEHREFERGSIEPGKVADFQVLDADIFQMPAEDIAHVGVDMTIAGGKIVYQKEV